MQQQRLDAFHVIADPSRRQMLYLLTKETLTINELAENFDMSRPAVSKHIKVLNESGFISIRNIGRERYCTIEQQGFKDLKKWLAYFDAFWGNKLKNLENLLINKKTTK
ncbi:MAG: metalloregulator ArsR/SmtB family transcription factor [Bacteroidota bacterium]